MGSLRSKIQILFGVLIALIGVMVGLSFTILAGNQVESRIKQDSEAATRVLVSLISESRQQLLGQTRLMASLVAVRDESRVSRLDPLGVILREHGDVDGLAAIDQNGKVRVLGGNFAGLTPCQALHNAARQAAKGHEWTGVLVANENLYLTAVVPLENSGPWVAVAAIRSVGRNLVRQLRDGTSAEVAFVVNKRVVASSMRVNVRLGSVADAWTITKVGGREYVTRYTPFPGTKLEQQIGLVAFRDLAAIEEPYHALGWTFISVLLIALGLTLGLSRAFARSLTHPIEATVNAVVRIRDGEWPDPLQVERNDEIGVLQAGINDMVSSLKSSQDRLMMLIDTDPLTDLDNHRRFRERLDQEVFRAIVAREPMSLALVDIDNFKDYNDRLGHAAGDEALQTIANLLREVAPKNALLARYGGEEFALVAPQSDSAFAAELVNRLRNLVATRMKAPFTISGGVAELTEGITTGSAFQLSAELALSRAKQLGKNQVCRFCSVPGADNTGDPFQLQKFVEDTTFATIQALAAAVDAKDPYTQGHSQRVARLASDLAKYVGCPPEEVDLVYRTGTLHDVGKIGVPDSILKKPQKLDDEELRVMETHPVLGEIIVKRAPQLEEMLPGVRHHHERWDGKGYPDKLMGSEIPRLARFIAIADAFDAMTSDRPYRRGMSVQVALNEVEKGAGSQFEPALAYAFVRMMKLSGFELRKAA